MRKILLLSAALTVLLIPQAAFAQSDSDCKDFATQAAAQTALRLDPSDPNGLDGAPGRNTVAGPVTFDDSPPHPGDGIACEDNPGTRDEEPVPAGPSSSTTTTGPTTTSGPSTTTSSGEEESLPFTGNHTPALLVVGLGALLVGIAFVRWG